MDILLSMSVTGGVMILVITLLRFLTQRYLHRGVFVALWILAMLRLCVPVFVPARSSVYNLFESDEFVVVTMQDPNAVEVNIPEQSGTVYEEPSIVEERISLDFVVGCVWLVGALGVGGYFTLEHVRSHRRFRFAVGQKEAELKHIRLARMDGLPAPLVYGLFRPKILLPEDFPEDGSEEYWHILHHEEIHVRNGDLWIKVFALGIVAFHWFNPFVWLMLYLLSADLEMRCDQQVIHKFGKKRSYALTLIRAEENMLSHLVHTCFAFSATEGRLKNIARARLNGLRSLFGALSFGAVLLLCFGTEASALPIIYEEPPVAEAVVTTDLPVTQWEEQKSDDPLLEFAQTPTEEVESTEADHRMEELLRPVEKDDRELPTEPVETQPPVDKKEEQKETAPVSPEESQKPANQSGRPYLGTFYLKVGETLSVDISDYSEDISEYRVTPYVSDPSLARAWTEARVGRFDKEITLYFTAYGTGYVEIYGSYWKNDREVKWLLAVLNIQASGDTDSMSFAEVDGNVPSIEIPEFNFNIPGT